jgi:hypothetical protein
MSEKDVGAQRPGREIERDEEGQRNERNEEAATKKFAEGLKRIKSVAAEHKDAKDRNNDIYPLHAALDWIRKSGNKHEYDNPEY